MLQNLRSNYSSEVLIELHVNGRTYSVERTGPDYVVLIKGADIPAGSQGELRILIDEREHLKQVKLVRGAVPFDRVVQTRAVIPKQ